MDQASLLHFLCTQLNRLNIGYFITGSHATIVYGDVRFTNDIDVVIDVSPADLEAFCTAFPEEDFYLSLPAARQALADRGMFNIIHPSSGLKIDVIIAQETLFHRSRMNRSVRFSIADDCEARFSSPEDIIVQKLQWHQMGGGERHLEDIRGVLKRQEEKLDRQYI
ncbi:MAG: hypothetical protein RID07_03450, partial [Lacipirellulaceae bacterium]